MKRLNVAFSVLLLVTWGIVNEYMHYVMWSVPGWVKVTIPLFSLVFQAAVWVMAVAMVGSASWIAFNDDIHVGIARLLQQRARARLLGGMNIDSRA